MIHGYECDSQLGNGKHESGLRRCWTAPKRTGCGSELVVKGYLLKAGRMIRNEDADYFTDDKQDAEATFNAMMDAERKVWE